MERLQVCTLVLNFQTSLNGCPFGMATALPQTDDDDWNFSIPIDLTTETERPMSYEKLVPNVPLHIKETFHQTGFLAMRHSVLAKEVCNELNRRLEEILRGRYATGTPPTKAPRKFRNEYRGSAHIRPKFDLSHMTIDERKAFKRPPPQAVVGPLGFNGNLETVNKVLQVINAHRADPLFRHVVYSFGPIVAELTGWDGVRLASDQIWAKPPHSQALAFHRDSPYFMFDPPHVVTVWIALDDMDEELGPLHYVSGSHLWGDEQWGAMDGFFDESMESLARASKDRKFEIISMDGMVKGGFSIHDGRTWHGSPRNKSKSRPRRGFGIHYVPAEVRFAPDAAMSQLWRPFVKDVIEGGGDIGSMEVPREHFPVVWEGRTGDK